RRFALRHRHFNLTKQRHNLLCTKPLLRHDQAPFQAILSQRLVQKSQVRSLGVQQCDPGLVLAARDLGATQQQIVKRVLIPSAIPAIFAGVRLGLGVSIILVVAAEMVVGRIGLGARLYLAGQILETEQVFAILIVLAILGIVVSKAQDEIDVRLGRWRIA
ncbi:MAG: ABC transporter permease subunit, partial [Pseudolabrys sp.]|nr:ABC transporter permease subunit [Pseudolabrys sp.]